MTGCLRVLGVEDQARVLDSLTRVGLGKAIGYLPLYTVRELLHTTSGRLIEEAASRGLTAVAIEADRCCIKSGALFVYHRETLANLLRKSASAVTSSELSIEPDRFIQQIAAKWFEPEHPIYPIIAAAFAELI